VGIGALVVADLGQRVVRELPVPTSSFAIESLPACVIHMFPSGARSIECAPP
jgi:hypothetical protein